MRLKLAHEQQHNSGGDEKNRAPESGHDEHPAAFSAEPPTASADDGGSDDARGRSNDSELAEVEAELASAEEALEGELIPAPRASGRSRRNWRAPLPSPEALAAYQDIDPTFAERIVRSYERQIEIAERREETVNSAVNAQVEIQTSLAAADILLTKRGQLMLYSIALLGLLCGVLFAVLGMTGPAIVSLVLGVLSLSVNLVTTVSAAGGERSWGRSKSGSEDSDDEAKENE